jgi:hypothetical protein
MPTSLPSVYSGAMPKPVKLPRVDRAIWILLAWAAVLLLFAGLANPGADTGAIDPFEMIATF